METESLTDRFEQIMLTEDQAKQVRDTIFKCLMPDANPEQDLQTFEVITNDEVAAYLPNVQDAYAPEKIQASKEHTEAE